MLVGKLIYQIRISKKLSLRDFARLVNLTHTTIARLESETYKDDGNIFIGTLRQICYNTGYDFRTFLEETGYLEPITTQQKIAIIQPPTRSEVQSLYDAMSQQQQNLLLAYGKGLLADSGIDFNKLA